MQDGAGAAAMRDAFYAGGCKNTGYHYTTGPAAWDTLLNPCTMDPFKITAQVGAWDGTAVNNGDGTVTFTIVNKAGVESFFYHLRCCKDRTGTTGPMRTITQTFTWTEKIDKSKCGTTSKPTTPQPTP